MSENHFRDPDRPDGPAFLVGITGNRDIHPEALATVEDRVRGFLSWLRDGAHRPLPGDPLGAPLGLSPNTPIILLSSLAPGADQVVARIAMKEFGIHVAAPLPFAHDLYARSTSFDDPAYAEARTFLEAFPKEHTFVVPLEKHAGWTEAEIHDDHEKRQVHTKAGDKEERDLCYRAAGEVVAAYAQVLLVLSPDAGSAPSASSPGSVAQAKLSGLTAGVVLGTPALTWAETGTVVHIRTPKTEARSTEGAGTLSLLEPGHERPAHSGHALFTLRRTARWLDQLNNEPARSIDEPHQCATEIGRALAWPPPPAGTSPRTGWPCMRRRMAVRVRSMLGLRAAPDHPRMKEHVALPPLIQAAAARMARVRRRVAQQNRHYDGRVKDHIVLLMALGLISVLALAFFEQLIPRYHEHDDHALDASLLRFFWYAVGCVGVVIIAQIGFRRSQATEKQDDYRALAEGIRVQFYWTVAGLRKSAATHYMMRQRGELSWVRSAIRSVSFPYWATHWEFLARPVHEQLETLRCVRLNWLKEQERYFTEKTASYQGASALLHVRRNVGLFAGLAFAILQAQTHRGHLGHCLEGIVDHHPYAVALANVACLLTLVVVIPFLRLRKQCSGAEDRNPHEHHLTPGAELWHSVRAEYAPALIGGSIIALVFGLGAYLLGRCSDMVPEGPHLLAMLRNVAFTYAGFNHLWGSLRFHTENIRRYDAMKDLFRSAGERLDAELARPTAGTDEVARAHQLLFELGREALSENAEWLGMHRDRPIEPVLPGA